MQELSFQTNSSSDTSCSLVSDKHTEKEKEDDFSSCGTKNLIRVKFFYSRIGRPLAI